jgi:hypothetical protein
MIRNVIENTLKTRIILMVLFMIGGNLLTAQQDSLFPRNLYQQMIGEHPQDPAKPEFYIRSRNNDYQLGLGGFVKLNGLYDFVGLANTNYFMTEEIPVGEENIKDNHLHFDIYQTRLYSEILGNTPYGEMKIYFECDFTNPIGLVKIRHAYGFIKGFLIGKTTSTLVDLEAIPYTVDAEGPNSMILARRVMVRYSFNAGKYITLFMAAEASQPQVTYSEYTEEVYQYLPDAVLRIRLKNERGHLSLGGLFRYFSYGDTLYFEERNKSGWGYSLSGSYRLFPKVRFLFQASYGIGIASYFHDFMLTQKDYVPSPTEPGRLVPVHVCGGFGSLEFKWTPKTKSTFTYSYLRAGDVGNKPPDAYEYGNYMSCNFFWNILPNFQVAMELLNGNRINENREKGSATRIYFMAKFDF